MLQLKIQFNTDDLVQIKCCTDNNMQMNINKELHIQSLIFIYIKSKIIKLVNAIFLTKGNGNAISNALLKTLTTHFTFGM